MLRPERMSKVSVAGSKRVLESTIETIHGMDLLHLSDYDESWEGFELGRSIGDAEATNEKLVTVRALESILGVTAEDATETILIDEAELDAELDALQQRVNELDDRKSDKRGRLRELDEQIDSIEPLAELGIDLGLLGGYDSLVVSVGQGNRKAIESTLADSEAVETFEVMSGGRTHAVFAKPADDADGDVLADALVGVEFTTVSVPDAEGRPEAYVAELQEEKAAVEADLDEINAELESIKTEQASFLLSAEEYLSIEAQKKQAPLSFATTENAFIAEGWIPTERYEEFESTLTEAVEGPLEIDEIKRADYNASGHATVEHDSGKADESTDQSDEAADTSADESGETQKARADGGVVTTDDEPPVVQNNFGIASPFEVIIKAVSRPKYSEFDPTILVFLTFPLMFGFMIGDIGYGLLYIAIGYYLYTQYESSGMRGLGGVALWAGAFTTLFGFFYDEFFGLHPEDFLAFINQPLPEYLGLPLLNKGLYPGYGDWALAWFVVSVLFGVLHLNLGYILSFVDDYNFHGFKEALYESGSWVLMLNGFWVFVFSPVAGGSKPDFIFTVFDGQPLALGFGGFSETVGLIGLAVFVLGLVLLAKASIMELVEFLNVLVNALSYTRIAAVLLAKAGMAFAVNLLVFGAYETEGGSYTYMGTGDALAAAQADGADIVFNGILTSAELSAVGILAVVGGVIVLVVGHLAVLSLGITSAGLQGVRLEYVEFFGKFYEGGGRSYNPFGYERNYTTTDD